MVFSWRVLFFLVYFILDICLRCLVVILNFYSVLLINLVSVILARILLTRVMNQPSKSAGKTAVNGKREQLERETLSD